MVTSVLVTGAHGRVGSAIRTHLSDRPEYELEYLDVDPHPEIETTVADVTDYEDVRPAVSGKDAVVHLAGEPSTGAPWERVLEQNIVGTYNVLEAARDAAVPKVAFASTNHVVGGYPDFRDDPETEPGALSVDHTAEPWPDSFYGVSKLFGEFLGKYYVSYEEFPSQFYAVRIGWVLGEAYDAPDGPAERGVDEGRFERGSEEYRAAVERCRTLWCSRRDVARFTERVLEDEETAFGIFAVRSGGENQWLDITRSREELGYVPLDDADEYDRTD